MGALIRPPHKARFLPLGVDKAARAPPIIRESAVIDFFIFLTLTLIMRFWGARIMPLAAHLSEAARWVGSDQTLADHDTRSHLTRISVSLDRVFHVRLGRDPAPA